MKNRVTTTELVAKEGYKYIIGAFVVLALAVYWGFSSLNLILLALAASAIVYFFRNPERISDDDDERAILSPTDGIIISIDDEYEDRFVKDDCVCVAIATSLEDAHFIRAPFASIFKAKNSLHGTFLPIKNEKAKSLNERFAAYFEGEKGHKYAISIIAGSLATKISLYKETDNKIRAGERMSFLKSEFQTILYLPKNVELKKAVGEKVKAGESVIGYFKDTE